jgi:hypothetical protein
MASPPEFRISIKFAENNYNDNPRLKVSQKRDRAPLADKAGW